MANAEDYRSAFEGKTDDQNTKRMAAFEQAVETRKFEIELYWKRAAYFWTLIAAALAGYFALQTAKSANPANYSLFSFVISCIGFFFSLAWLLVNKGSKFWQENWENHVAVLGRDTVGPLYEWVLRRPKWRSNLFVGPAAISVSKINHWVSWFVLIIWLFLMALSSPELPIKLLGPSHKLLLKHPYLVVSFFTACMSIVMVLFSKTHLDLHTPVLVRMKTSVRNPER